MVRITHPKTNVGSIETDIAAIETDIAAIETVILSIETDTGNIETDTGNIETDTGNIATNTGYLAKTTLKFEEALTTTASSDSAFKLTSALTECRQIIINVETNNAYMGNSTNQYIYLPEGTVMVLDAPLNNKIDINTIYFKNAVAGENIKVNIVGVD